MTVGIIGQGFVGNAIYKKFKNYFQVNTFDIVKDKCTSSKEETLSQDLCAYQHQ